MHLSNSHNKSRLQTSDTVFVADSNTSEIFHYDVSPNGALNGTKPADSLYDDSLVLWLDSNNLNSGGTYVLDKSRYGNHAKINGPTMADGKNGKALSFDGNDDYLELVSPLQIYNSSFTIAMWVNFTEDNREILFGDYGLPGYCGVNFEKYTTGALRLYWNGAPDILTGSIAHVGSWCHLVVVRDKAASNVVFYVDGTAAYTYSGALADITTTVKQYIGRDYRTGITAMNGRMDSTMIFKRALSATEVSYLYNQSIYFIAPSGKYGGAIAVEEDTTNIVPNPHIFSSGWGSYGNGNDGAFMTEFGVEALNLINRRSWCGASKSITLPAIGTYTFSVWVKVLSRTNVNVQQTLYTSGFGLGDTNVFASWAADKIGKWQRLSMTLNCTTTSGTLYLICYGGSDAAGYEITCQYTMPQIERKTFATSFVNGNRTTGKLAYSPDIIDLSEGTMSCWFYASTAFLSRGLGDGWNRICGHSTAVNVNEIQIDHYDGYNKITFTISNNAGTPAVGWTSMVSRTLTTDTWYHVAVTWSKSAGAANLYVNGTLDAGLTGLTADQFPSVKGLFAVGYHPQCRDRTANTMIDELRIDKVARSAEEIMSWYLSGSPFYPRGNEIICL